jgi:acyl-CoA synthetase (AMP-forming)/AMP-acid ligase II
MNPFPRIALARDTDLTLGRLLEELAQLNGDRRLVEEHGTGLALTYREGAQRVAEYAAGIAAKSEPGDRVVIAAANGYEFFLLCLAASRAGTVPVPVNPQMTKTEVDYVIDDSSAHLVVRTVDEVSGSGRLDAAAPCDAGDTAAIFYTSGTTGKPKGAELTHRALLGSAALAALYPAGLRRDEMVCGMPVAHIAGFTILLMTACLGVPLYLLPKFRPDWALDAIESRRATAFIGVPAMYRMMVEAGAEQRDLHSIRRWASGADAMPDDLIKVFKRLGATATLPIVNANIGEAIFIDGYGMVELAGGAAIRISLPFIQLPLVPLPGYQLKAVDENGDEVGMGEVGELAVKGPGVLKGYHGKKEATEEVLLPDGFLRTGDLARRQPFGLVSLAGRKKHVIKHGGYSVFAVEVEHTLEEHPDIVEAAVVGLPDERKGEIPVAVVRLREGADVTPDALVAWAAEHMADYKTPRQVRIVDDLPRTGTDKVQKDKLAELFAGGS